MAMDWNRFAELFLTNTAPTLLALAAVFRALQKNQKRIEEKADGNHARSLEAVKETSRENVEQLIRAVEKVLTAQAAQAKQRGRRRTDPP